MCKIVMPSCYNILSPDEISYIEGGATKIQAFCAWFAPFYGWYKGVIAIRNYRDANRYDWLTTGLDALADDMEKSPENLYYDLGCSFHVLGTSVTGIGLLVNLAIILN